jgi:hypothetical protein
VAKDAIEVADFTIFSLAGDIVHFSGRWRRNSENGKHI